MSLVIHGDIIAKSLSITPIKMDGDYSIFFTTRIGAQDDVDLSGLSIAPAILQQEIKNKKDIRVTIVGSDIFPCFITPKETISDEVDWRVGINSDEVNYEPFPQFPEHLRDQCLNYLNRLGLSYGVVEFALDQQGGYWFLEINPNGQWGFIEEETGMEISKSIARILRSAGKK